MHIYVFAQTILFLQFQVRTYNPRVCWQLIYFSDSSMNVVNLIGRRT